jgi:micrococcal nuclease
MKIYLLLILLLISGCITGNTTLKLEGPYEVTKVVDGDTLDLDNGDRVRFSGINTPETGECYHDEAWDRLIDLVLNKKVYTEKDKSDTGKYGRKLRYIYVDNKSVNKIMVKEGYARVYDKYKDDTKRYNELKEAELIAIKNNLGVWACDNPKSDCLYVGSKNSKKYHTPECKYAKKILPNNLVCYNSEPENKEFSGC